MRVLPYSLPRAVFLYWWCKKPTSPIGGISARKFVALKLPLEAMKYLVLLGCYSQLAASSIDILPLAEPNHASNTRPKQ